MADVLKINYKLFLEAEDISQSRIASSTAFVKNIIGNHANPYIRLAELDDESELEDFILRLYADESIEEQECKNREAAEGFVDDMAALLSEVARMHSFLDMEGSFSIEYEGESLAYRFASGGGNIEVDFQKM